MQRVAVVRAVAHEESRFAGVPCYARAAMKETLRVINEMRDAGVISDYAIGGAIGALFYLEPIETQDLDVFVALPRSPEGTLLTLGPIYEHLLARGFQTRAEYVIVHGWDVQFVPPGKPLVEEALAEAVEQPVEELRVRVFTAEHLAAICLDVGRSKDIVRLIKFLDECALDADRFEAIVRRHGLLAKRRDFEKIYRRPPHQ